MDLSEIAFKAAEVLSEKGLCKDRTQDSQGRLCYYGAVLTAMYGERNTVNGLEQFPYTFPGAAAVAGVSDCTSEILAERGEGAITPNEYNDRPETTAEDVILLLKETGARLS
jgi:hypothetical protein